MIVINADNKIFGRIASFAAEKALDGEEIVIVNSEKAIISGRKEIVMQKFKRWVDMRGKGNPEKGPQYSRMPDKILKNAVRKMLPKTGRGETAMKRIKVHIGTPKETEGKKFFDLKEAEPKKIKVSVELGEICKLLGAKI